MQANVWEWVEDVYDEGFYGKPEASGPDPVSKAGSVIRVFRGGGWFYVARYCRSSIRFRGVPVYRVFYLGCRPARPAP